MNSPREALATPFVFYHKKTKQNERFPCIVRYPFSTDSPPTRDRLANRPRVHLVRTLPCIAPGIRLRCPACGRHGTSSRCSITRPVSTRTTVSVSCATCRPCTHCAPRSPKGSWTNWSTASNATRLPVTPCGSARQDDVSEPSTRSCISRWSYRCCVRRFRRPHLHLHRHLHPRRPSARTRRRPRAPAPCRLVPVSRRR
jgi:hypothetical protein